MTAAPDWYPDPSGSGGLRYWDGQQWTGHLAPAPHQTPYGAAPHPMAYPGAAVATTPDGARLAGWWHRVGAAVLDQLLLTLISLPFSIAVQVSMQDRLQNLLEEMQRRIDENDPGVMNWYFRQLFHQMHPYIWVYFAQGAIALVLFTVCLRRWGGSPGQLVTGLRVRLRERPGNLGWGRAALRALLSPVLSSIVVAAALATGSIALALLAIGFFWIWGLLDPLWAAWDSKRQTLHDKIVSTNVVRAR